jgi:hypothetical protein
VELGCNNSLGEHLIDAHQSTPAIHAGSGTWL